MGQPHKGERRLIGSRIPNEVYPLLEERAKAAGTSVSQYVADLAVCHVGRPDLVWQPKRSREEELPLAI